MTDAILTPSFGSKLPSLYSISTTPLPPLDWQFSAGYSSFKMMEMYSGNITDIYVQLGEAYFKLRDHVTLPHSQIMTRVSAFRETESAQAAA